VIQLKRAGRRVGVVLTESPYDVAREAKYIRYVDIAWTNERASVPFLRRFNPNTFYLPHAYSSERHNTAIAVPDDTPAHDVVFVGTAFQERIDTIRAVDWSDIDLG